MKTFRKIALTALVSLFTAACASSGEDRCASDLIPYARLYAEGTANFEPFSWVRESEDAIAAIRDDSDKTCFRGAGGTDAFVFVDFAPAAKKKIPLKSAEIKTVSESSLEITVSLLAACGGTALKSFAWSDLNDELDLDWNEAACIRLDIRSDAEYKICGLAVYGDAASMKKVEFEPQIKSQTVKYFEGSGVIEGFYGVPYSFAEREKLVKTLAAYGLQFYMYAPKEDPLHRAKWREKYDDLSVDKFVEFSRLAKKYGVTFFFGISPFIDFNFDEDADYETLKNKIAPFIEKGISGVGLLADDIEMETSVDLGRDLGQKHAAVLNRLYADLKTLRPDLFFNFTPTVYSDERMGWKGGEDYLAQMGALDAAVAVMWTGKGTSNETMKPEDMAKVTQLCGRAPIIWDNFWANDGGDKVFGNVFLSPFYGREEPLLGAVGGLAHNASIQGSFARLVINTFGAFMDEPFKTLALDDARKKAVKFEFNFSIDGAPPNESGEAALLLAMRVFSGNAQKTSAYEPLDELAQSLAEKIKDGTADAKDVLNAINLLAPLASLYGDIYHSNADADLADEFVYPLLGLRFHAKAGLYAAMKLAEKLGGQDGAQWDAPIADAKRRAKISRFLFNSGKISEIIDAVNMAEPKNTGVAKADKNKIDLNSRAVGKEIKIKPFLQPLTVSVFGLPGAAVKNGEIIWAPPHPGAYDVIAAAYNENTVGISEFTLVCE